MVYRQLDHTADVALEVTAPTLQELFADAARALASCVTDVDVIEPRRRLDLRLEAPELDALLVDYLGELLFHFDESGFLPCAAAVDLERGEGGRWTLAARLRGEPIDLERHPFRTQIKGVTWHGIAVERLADESWRATVILDV